MKSAFVTFAFIAFSFVFRTKLRKDRRAGPPQQQYNMN
jgi:hypothetical protein